MLGKWKCNIHNQEEWTCSQWGDEYYHVKNTEAFNSHKDKKNIMKPIRCMNCMCENKNNTTDEIYFCPIYNSFDFKQD